MYIKLSIYFWNGNDSGNPFLIMSNITENAVFFFFFFFFFEKMAKYHLFGKKK